MTEVRTPQLHPIVYQVMIQHWMDNQPCNCIQYVNTKLWDASKGVRIKGPINLIFKEIKV